MSFPRAPCPNEREHMKYYRYTSKNNKEKIGVWKKSTSRWLCIHKKDSSSCKKCEGFSLCEHLKKRKTCILCRNLYLLSDVCYQIKKYDHQYNNSLG